MATVEEIPLNFLGFVWNVWRRCQWCNRLLRRYPGHADSATIDHIQAASDNGPWEWSNFCLSCWECNNQKSDAYWGLPRYGPYPWKFPEAMKPASAPKPIDKKGQWVLWVQSSGVWRLVRSGPYKQCVQALTGKLKAIGPTKLIPQGEAPGE